MSSRGRPGDPPLLRRAWTDNGPDRPDAMRSLVFERLLRPRPGSSVSASDVFSAAPSEPQRFTRDAE
jgi:hypothetical protein